MILLPTNFATLTAGNGESAAVADIMLSITENEIKYRSHLQHCPIVRQQSQWSAECTGPMFSETCDLFEFAKRHHGEIVDICGPNFTGRGLLGEPEVEKRLVRVFDRFGRNSHGLLEIIYRSEERLTLRVPIKGIGELLARMNVEMAR